MTKQTINIGATANDRTGDSLRTAFNKVNENFSELYTALGLDTNGLNLGAFTFTGSVLSTDDSTNITVDRPVTVNGEIKVHGDITPERNDINLGSASKPFKSLYVSNSTIYFGGNALGINDQGELTFNDNRVAHEAGEFMTLNNLSDLNVGNPNAGDTIAWAGSQWVNVPLTQDRLAHNGDEVVLVGGANPYVTFPAITGGDQLVIQGGEVTASSGNLALTGQSTVTVISNAAGAGGVGAQYFQFAADGTLMFPDGSLALTDSVLNNGLDADIKGSVFGDDSTILVDGVSGVLRANVNVANTWTVTTGNKTWSFIYGDVEEGTIPTLEFPGNLQAAQSQTALFARTGDLSGNWGMTIDAGNSPYSVDIGEINGASYWRFDGNGSITFPDTTVQTTAWAGIPGPYADDAAAATAGVAVGYPYHKTGTSGQVFVRLS